MSDPLFKLAPLNAPMPSPARADESVLKFLAGRRSTPIKTFVPQSEGPSVDEIDNILNAAMRVPDHRKLGPWRAIIFRGDARHSFNAHLLERFRELNPSASDAELAEEGSRLLRAPVCVTITSSPVDDGKTPVWEQELSAGALCLNLLYMAHAAGFAATWLSEWWAFDEVIARKMGLSPGERIAGNIFIGQSQTELFERPRPDFASRISEWKG